MKLLLRRSLRSCRKSFIGGWCFGCGYKWDVLDLLSLFCTEKKHRIPPESGMGSAGVEKINRRGYFKWDRCFVEDSQWVISAINAQKNKLIRFVAVSNSSAPLRSKRLLRKKIHADSTFRSALLPNHSSIGFAPSFSSTNAYDRNQHLPAAQEFVGEGQARCRHQLPVNSPWLLRKLQI